MARLTSAEIRNIQFRKPPLGKRGYDADEVDEFLQQVGQTLGALEAEIASLGGRFPAGQGYEQNGPYGTSTAAETAVLAELDAIKVRLARIEAAVADRARPQPVLGQVYGAPRQY